MIVIIAFCRWMFSNLFSILQHMKTLKRQGNFQEMQELISILNCAIRYYGVIHSHGFL